jgi:hypothetical protein
MPVNAISRIIMIAVAGAAASANAAQVVRGPFLQAAGANRMAVCWRTDVECTTEVAFGADLQGTFASEVVPGMRTEHVVELTGLAAGSRYFYRVLGTPASGAAVNAGGADYWFRTAPAAGAVANARFWVVGDSGYPYVDALNNYNIYMAQTAAAGKTTAGFIMLGDNAYDVGTDAQIQAVVFNRYSALLRNTPLWSAFGNHDAYAVVYPHWEVTPYETAFRFPTAGECGGVMSGTERYFSFDHGGIHFISLDTFTPGKADDALGGTYGMADWLKADLASCEADWIVAFMHLGPYSRGSHDTDVESAHVRAHAIPLLEQYGADLILCGHSHVYERSRLIDGHYGTAATWNPATMLKQDGNGSDLGGVSATGAYVPGMGTGGYRKAAATPRAGAVYVVIGASSEAHRWSDGSTTLVSPNPHPVHVTNLLLLGSMVLEIQANRLSARYLDKTGATRDDFTLTKGALYTLQPAAPMFAAPGAPGAAFTINRTGSLAAEQVSVSFIDGNGTEVPPGTFNLAFGEGQSFMTTTVPAPTGAGPGTRYRLRINPLTRALQPGAAPRRIYQAAVDSQAVEFGPTPAMMWYATWFPGQVPAQADWVADGDRDGASVLLEYALGGSPVGGDAIAAPRVAVENGKLVFRYVRPPGRSDLTYRVEQFADLVGWQTVAGEDVNDGAATAQGEPRRVAIPMGGPMRFLRLAVDLAS